MKQYLLLTSLVLSSCTASQRIIGNIADARDVMIIEDVGRDLNLNPCDALYFPHSQECFVECYDRFSDERLIGFPLFPDNKDLQGQYCPEDLNLRDSIFLADSLKQ
ncbi:hypothetical protein HN681_02030 [archaeon]|jgi:hypothetical protein|nr:hypothetical protein [archaeon]MBT3731355.1 hypothetical protein [archaeon]MBT4670342.1 hypothetical protein [archaeon]MBT5029640.1 hypothetical protein [archaeon]MBT5287611.1 hypothetical protein [archaeon]